MYVPSQGYMSYVLTFTGVGLFWSSWPVGGVIEPSQALLAVSGYGVVPTHASCVHLPLGHLLPRPGQARGRMSVAHAAAPHDPLPDCVVLEAAVGEDGDLGKEVQHDHAQVGNVAVTC